MQQLQVLKTIYTLLKEKSATVTQIIAFLKTEKIARSDRQVKRNLKDLAVFFLKDDEQLIVDKQKRAFRYKITQKNQIQNLSPKTINTLSLAMAASPNILIKNRKNDIDFLRKLVKAEMNKSKETFSGQNLDTLIQSTNFYEIEKDALFEKNIDKLIDAIANRKIATICLSKKDYTGDNGKFSNRHFEFKPLKIIYHRGAFLIAGFAKQSFNEIVLFEISQLIDLKIEDETFDNKQLLQDLQALLDQRFGISKNNSDEIYQIKLEFTEVTGSLVKKYTWHHSQQFEVQGTNFIMSMKCGINRELLDWLFQWMHNVRIIEPPILIDTFNDILERIKKRQDLKFPLTYDNFFNPE